MCRAKNGELLTNKDQVLSRWKDNFEQHLNEGGERDQPTKLTLEIMELKTKAHRNTLKNNKTADIDLISAELLKTLTIVLGLENCNF
jgi:hypothetical protein